MTDGGSAGPLAIGYGNPLRGDDGLGWHVARALDAMVGSEAVGGSEEAVGSGLATVLACHQLTPELAESIARARLVVFVDARAGGMPGRVEARPVDDEAAPAGGWAFSHHVTPALLLAAAAYLFGSRPAAYLVTVDGASFECGSELSAPVAAAVPLVVERVRELLGQRVDGARLGHVRYRPGCDGRQPCSTNDGDNPGAARAMM
ncbi:MAG: hydrogenase maturation protease [Chloroflexi bacterium]|nr:hydrogenase maturation protease [Chloroflexota bacterium]